VRIPPLHRARRGRRRRDRQEQPTAAATAERQ
jgi:hypothetical protein